MSIDNFPAAPGQEWLEIIGRPTPEAFAAAFTEKVTLETSVTNGTMAGAADIRHFFDATRSMYDHIEFTKETTAPSRTYLEWEGSFTGHAIAGLTVQSRQADGRIKSIRVYYRSFDAVVEFSAELTKRLADAPSQLSP